MVTPKDIDTIGTGLFDPTSRADARVAELQASINVTEALKAIALVLVDIRDGKKDEQK